MVYDSVTNFGGITIVMVVNMLAWTVASDELWVMLIPHVHIYI